MSRKVEALDLMALYSKGSNNGWNDFLAECRARHDINRLARMRYALQAGMDDLAKKKLNSDEMVAWFLRLQRSIENTVKSIIRERHPNPLDNAIRAAQPGVRPTWDSVKKQRDQLLEEFFRKSGY